MRFPSAFVAAHRVLDVVSVGVILATGQTQAQSLPACYRGTETQWNDVLSCLKPVSENPSCAEGVFVDLWYTVTAPSLYLGSLQYDIVNVDSETCQASVTATWFDDDTPLGSNLDSFTMTVQVLEGNEDFVTFSDPSGNSTADYVLGTTYCGLRALKGELKFCEEDGAGGDAGDNSGKEDDGSGGTAPQVVGALASVSALIIAPILL